MYVITHHHDYDEVLLGPIEWNPRFISSVLRDDLELSFTPNVLTSDEKRVPYEIFPNVWIRRVEFVNEEHNPKIHTLMGPYWEYNGDQAKAYYKKQDKSPDLVKSELKQIVTAKRYDREIAGATVNVQGTDVRIDTTRDNRNVYSQKYLLMADNETVSWKFAEGWFNLSKSEMAAIVQAGASYIQAQFDWENAKHAEIDSCNTLEELDALTLE